MVLKNQHKIQKCCQLFEKLFEVGNVLCNKCHIACSRFEVEEASEASDDALDINDPPYQAREAVHKEAEDTVEIPLHCNRN